MEMVFEKYTQRRDGEENALQGLRYIDFAQLSEGFQQDTLILFFQKLIDHLDEFYNQVLSHSVFILFFIRDLINIFEFP